MQQDWRNVIPDEDKPVVAEMRKRLAADGISVGRHDHDSFLARFSRARKRNVDKAYEMLTRCLEWRIENRVDDMYEWWETSPEHAKLFKYYPYENSATYGFAKEGRPLHLDHYPLIEPSTIINTFGGDVMVKDHMWVMEKALDAALEQTQKEGRVISDQVFVFNTAGLGMRHLRGDVMEAVKECFQIDERYYPEIVNVALVINAPRIFTLLFKLLSPFVDPDTLAKTKILGSEWTEEALKYMTPENIPSDWHECGKGPKWVKTAGGFVIAGEGQNQQSADVQIAARDVTNVPFTVEGDNFQLAYEFSSVDFDIEFGIVMLGEKEKQIVIEKTRRYDAHVEPVSGLVTKLKAGSYHLVFNNAYSWTTAKQVKLTFYISAPPPPKTKSQKARERKKKNKKAASAK